mmetsp:Transcript_41163/g.68446  ORF Transcript_41163/g.68446 Transcript_41163/m.68446 type:complete len:340 (+) Transcript_41163:162-1181(+)|eukprot:CAMPEP_0119312712 /NCGR_PEP_ID=MMETSP1333-20130426/26967_1 /TAXON_ID=418940 /ORGANISM="Scyphosphaera apsteinii, Strain RCC1455" /LENGTH=339 /DNA_ID=CAMNT_0007317369 /DNA_START=157 /DNA_END=1176 /DNA_ORIENTATION=+
MDDKKLTLNNTGVKQYDDETEKMLDNWVLAKRGKDFPTADRLRDQLRAKGIEPDKARPPDRNSQPSSAGTPGLAITSLQQISPALTQPFVAPPPPPSMPPDQLAALLAMQQQDSASDLLGQQTAHDSQADGKKDWQTLNNTGVKQYDDETEKLLDNWVLAKRGKDFSTADRLRDEIRAKGIEPDKARPPDRSAPNNTAGGSMQQAQALRQLQQLQQLQALQQAQLQQAQALQLQQLTGQPLMGGQLVGQPVSDLSGMAGSADYTQYSAVPTAPPSKRARKLDIQATKTFDESTESRLDDWIEAKRAKQFAKADAIREELRALGIEPDEVRPPGRNFGKA